MKSALFFLLSTLLILPAAAQIYTSATDPAISAAGDGRVGVWGQYSPGFNPADNWTLTTNAIMMASPKLADINHDGVPEILMTTFDVLNPYGGGYLHAWNGAGVELTGFPVHLTGAPPGTPAVGDLNNDGNMEIVQGTWNYLYVFNSDGTPYPGWPLPMYITQSVTLADLDNNGDLEIIVPVNNEMRVYHHDGTPYTGFPVTAGHDLTAAAVGDLEGDGSLEIVAGSFVASGSASDSIYAWHSNGRLVNGFPVAVAGSVKSSPALADVDNDGQLEIIADCWSLSATDQLYVIQFNGTMKQGWPVPAAYSRLSSPSVGDLDRDGKLEIVVGGWNTAPYGEKIFAFHDTGVPVSGFPVVLPNNPSGNLNSSCAIGNINSDGYPEIVVKATNNIFALTHNGVIVPGFPIFLDDQNHSGTFSPTPAIGDMDHDGLAEIFAASCFSTVMLIDQPGANIPALNYWPTFRRDTANRGASPVTNPPNLDVLMIPPPGSGPFVMPAQGGSFSFTAEVVRHGGPMQPFTVWARMRNPNGSFTAPTLGPVNINPPLNAWVSRVRTQNIPGSFPLGSYLYIGYAGYSLGQIVDSSYFAFMKSGDQSDGPFVWDDSCTGEPFPGEIAFSSQPSAFSLCSVSPNPFNPKTAISYQLSANSHVSLRVYDMTGRLVTTLVDDWQAEGTHQVTFDGSKLSSGLYFVRMQAGTFSQVRKMMLVK